MMKLQAGTETMNIGALELGNLTFEEDYMEVCLDILDMSDELKAEVNKAIEIEKVEYSRKCEKANAERGMKYNTEWSNEPVAIDSTYLRVILEAGKPIRYSIEFNFSDVNDRFMEWGGSIAVDLSAYANELKLTIINALVSKFF